jgi:hypothetical protein
MEICIDFDGTCVTHEYPRVGKDIGSIPVLNKIIENGHKIILFTMRSNKNVLDDKNGPVGDYLNDAINWFKENNIPLYGVNVNPNQFEWTSSPKAYGQLYIDDSSIGCPLVYDDEISYRPFVDWKKVEDILLNRGII